MPRNRFIALTIVWFSISSSALVQPLKVPHYDLQMTSRDYSRELKNRQAWGTLATGPLDPVLEAGKRSLQWLDYMNSFRDDAHKIHLTRPGDLTGIPIEAPVVYSQNSVRASYSKIQIDMPVKMARILFEAQSFSKNPPVDLTTYIKWARKLDHIYQTGARWILLQPYMDWLTNNKALDVRGIYFLEKNKNLQQDLNNWDKLSATARLQNRSWLTQLCYNNKGLGAGCEQEESVAEANHQLWTFFQSYESSGKDMWNDFFQIPTQRTDVSWQRAPQAKMLVPFIAPDSVSILNFLRDNIEDEWKTSSWNLRLDFHAATDPGVSPTTMPHVEFQPGVTPHVNAIAGNIITMDQNSPLDEWDVQWIIRHEFGHVLGFLDCYLEIYDPQTQSITSYQMDLTDLMCSRQGKFQQQHFDLLQKTYGQ